MGAIKGETVTLYDKVQVGTDEFNAPVYGEIPTEVDNVLITPVGDADVVNDVQLYGKRAEYELSIPKGDTHEWADRRVEFWGQSYQTFGFTREYMEHQIPLSWNKKVKVARNG